MIFGRDEKDHKENLTKFLNRAKEMGVVLSREKCSICVEEIDWFGMRFGRDGGRADPVKLEHLAKCEPPKTTEEVRSYLQAAQFNARFMFESEEAYASVTYPLRQMLKKGARYKWGAEENKAFKQIQEALMSTDALRPYDPELPLEHFADAQPHGIASSVYMVETSNSGTKTYWPLNHVSRSTSPAEERYGQVELESLAQSWGIRQNRYYLLGKHFTTWTDHQPLLTHYNNRQRKAPTRVDRHRQKIDEFDFTMGHVTGKQMPCDWDSRRPLKLEHMTKKRRAEQDTDESDERYVCAVKQDALDKINETLIIRQILAEDIVNDSTPEAITEEELREVSKQDEDYLNAIRYAKSGKTCDKPNLGPYSRIKEEIEVHDGLLMRGEQLVIPKAQDKDGNDIRRRIIDLAHESHAGEPGTKTTLRQSVYFPGMDEDTKRIVGGCSECLIAVKTEQRDPLKPTPIPEEPYERVSTDHYGPVKDRRGQKRHLLVVIDQLTKYLEVATVKSTSAKDNIPIFDQVFKRHGYPRSLLSDNGPPFNGRDTHLFQRYMRWAGVKHKSTHSADDARANGLAESAMKGVKKAWDVARLQGRDPLAAVADYVHHHNTRIHASTGLSPSEYLFGRKIRTRIPGRTRHTQEADRDKARKKARDTQMKQKQTYDAKRATRPNKIEVGDMVIKPQRKTKEDPPYDPRPYLVTEKHGSQITIQRGDSSYKRDCEKVKRYEPVPKIKYEKKQVTFDLDDDYLGASSDEEEAAKPSATKQDEQQQAVSLPPTPHRPQRPQADTAIRNRGTRGMEYQDSSSSGSSISSSASSSTTSVTAPSTDNSIASQASARSDQDQAITTTKLRPREKRSYYESPERKTTARKKSSTSGRQRDP